MAGEFYDSMRHYNSLTLLGQKWSSYIGGSLSLNATAGPRGGRCIQIGPHGFASENFVIKNLIHKATQLFGFHIFIGNDGDGTWTGSRLITFYDSGIRQVSLDVGKTGMVTARRGATTRFFDVGTLIGTSSNGLPFSQWIYLGIKLTVHSSSGVLQVYLGGDSNGIEILNLSGVNTQASPNAWTNGIGINNEPATGTTPTVRYADTAMASTAGSAPTDLWGTAAAICLSNTGADTSDWTSTEGANWQAISEEPPDGDTTYNSSATNGHIDLFSGESLPSDADEVVDVAQTIYHRHTGGGAGLVRTMMESNAVQGDNGSNIYVPASYAFAQGFHPLNPDTGVAWTPAEVNAALRGYKNVNV